jgi:uncharacterized protein (DUF2062 family)
MTRVLAMLVAAALTTNCAVAAYQTKPSGPVAAREPAGVVTAEYLRALPGAARVKIRLTDGESLKGDLMVVRDTEIVVQPRTRIPVRPRTIAIDRLASVELQRENHVGRAIAVGAAVGAAAAVGVFLALIAAIAD